MHNRGGSGRDLKKFEVFLGRNIRGQFNFITVWQTPHVVGVNEGGLVPVTFH
jgi:hypothetical protein